MKHHYVPAFYLREFTGRITPDDNEPYLWVVDLRKRRISKRAPKNVAVRSDYYAVGGKSGGKDHSVETWFSQIESFAKRPLERILQGNTALDTTDREILAYFIALQIVRVPSSREPAEKFLTEIAQICSELMLMDRKEWDQSVKATDPSREFSSEELDRQYAWAIKPQNIQTKANPDYVLDKWLRAVPKVANVIKDMSLSFMSPQTGRTFWTSDAPVSWINPKSSSPLGRGLMSQHIELSFPIGPRVCLLANWATASDACLQLNDDDLLHRNKLTIAGAEFAFCDSEAAAQDILRASQARRPE